MADGFYRAGGRPLAVITSIGPGAVNTAIGAANAFVDSTPVLIVTGSAHTHMRGKGLLQEIERTHDANFARMLEPVVKRYWTVDSPAQLPTILNRAFNQMLTGRRGPVLIDLPMDVQAAEAEVRFFEPRQFLPRGRVQGDPDAVAAAAELLAGAKRPVVLVGGGLRAAGAEAELVELCESLGAAVVTTLMGKGSFPEDHPLAAWLGGSKGTTVGNAITSRADVLLAVGCRFADETASSYKEGVTFSIPPTKLIHVDIDPAEIGKNYPVEVGIVGDAREVLRALIAQVQDRIPGRDYRGLPYYRELERRRGQWLRRVHKLQSATRVPVTISRALLEVRRALPAEAFVVTSSGNVQAQLLQEFPFTRPGTCISAGGFSAMGFSLPAAIGVKLARPDRPVAALVGDGDFMMTMQEMSTAMQVGAKVVVVVFNNQGWLAIKDLQMAAFGRDRAIGTDFTDARGRVYSPDFQATAAAFGWRAFGARRPGEVEPAVRSALAADGPALVEVMVNRLYPHSGSPAVGWWDVPIPAYLNERRARYEKEKEGERL
jgi:acetolactate synthase-1/2/3 large subunit